MLNLIWTYDALLEEEEGTTKLEMRMDHFKEVNYFILPKLTK